MAEEKNCKMMCMRCGHEFYGHYEKGVAEERFCPKCASYSIRPMPEKKSTPAKKEK
jgi:formylmethanofuran dehydrogenase subunit E